MTDRELLELAAKAAEIEFNDKRSPTGSDSLYCANQGWWNPLADDGDALRLAVRLRIEIAYGPNVVSAEWDGDCWQEPFGDDPLVAARRAIVRAAAAMAG